MEARQAHLMELAFTAEARLRQAPEWDGQSINGMDCCMRCLKYVS